MFERATARYRVRHKTPLREMVTSATTPLGLLATAASAELLQLLQLFQCHASYIVLAPIPS
jgi:hypothetical protein